MPHIFYQVCKDHVFEPQSKPKKISHLLTEISLNMRNVEAVTPMKGKRKNKGFKYLVSTCGYARNQKVTSVSKSVTNSTCFKNKT
jgi:hypothetical protein